MGTNIDNSLRAVKAWQTIDTNKNKKYFDYPPTQNELKKVLKNNNRKRALKAWETMRKRGYVTKGKKYSTHIKDYDCKNKNKFRNNENVLQNPKYSIAD